VPLVQKYAEALARFVTRVINYATRETLQIVVSLTDNTRSIIYKSNIIIIQTTGGQILNYIVITGPKKNSDFE
jgi:hypothetical protein